MATEAPSKIPGFGYSEGQHQIIRIRPGDAHAGDRVRLLPCTLGIIASRTTPLQDAARCSRKRCRIVKTLGIALLLAVILAAACSTPNPNPDATVSAYEQVQCGMTRDQVYALLGDPRSTEPAGDVAHCRKATWGIPHGSHGWGHWTVIFQDDTVTGVETGHATVSASH